MSIFNYSKLLGEIKANGFTQKQIADKIGISETSFNKKLKGNSQFNQTEIKQILACLNLNISQVAEYFFCPNTCENASIS